MSLFLPSLAAGVLTVGSLCLMPARPLRFARPGHRRLLGSLALGVGAVMLQPVHAAVPKELPVLGPMPPLSGASGWLQSRPLSVAELRGKVVLVEFWTFGCVNCQRALPSVRTWAKRYRDEGLVVVGVHAPEFAAERERVQVERAVAQLGLDFPIAMDNDFAIWKAWSNQYWPSLYLVDAQGRVRWRHIGEGAYDETEQAIRQLLGEARRAPVAGR